MNLSVKLLLLHFIARFPFLPLCSRIRKPTLENMSQIEENFDVHMYEGPTLMKTNDSLPSLKGCEIVGKYMHGVIIRSKIPVVATECLKCKPGWLEKPVVVALPRHLQELRVKGSKKMLKRICEWEPCGALCGTCSNKKKAYWSRREYYCKECKDTGYGESALVANEFTAMRQVKAGDGEGKPVTITKTCAPTVASRSGKRFVNAHSLMTSVMDMFIVKEREVPKAEASPTIMLQALQEFVIVCTSEFLASIKKDEQFDMVEKGSAFMRNVIDSVIKTAPNEQLVQIGRTLASSTMLADTRGALEVCTYVAFSGMGDDSDPKFALYRAATSGCTGLENAIRLLVESVCSSIKCGKIRESTDFHGDIDKAPRRTHDVMRMFGLLDSK